MEGHAEMKKIYTSNYARHGNNPNAIGISLTIPEWYEGKRLEYLAPRKEMVGKIKRGEINYNQRRYTMEYLDLLRNRNVDPQKLIDSLPDGAILLCYESPGEFCHRRVLADWVERHIGFIIPEWKNEEELEKEEQNKKVDSILDF